MNTHPVKSLLPIAAALVLAATLVPAHATSERVEVQGHALPSTDAAAALQGSYVLDNGQTLEVSRQNRRLLWSLDGGSAEPLTALSPTRLRSADGRVTLDFNATPNGSVYALRMSTAALTAPPALR